MAALNTFRNDGLTFDVDDTGGQGEAVVLLHGFPGSKASWDDVTPQLTAAVYRVLAPDQRGYSPGARPRGRRRYAMRHLVDDLMALADAAEIERFHVVGHDWGGAVAWATAAWHPERLLTMTSLTTPHPRAMLSAMWSSNQALRSWYMLFFQLPWLPEATFMTGLGAKAFTQTLVESGLSPERAEKYVCFMRSGAAGPAINWYRGIPFTWATSYGRITVPTLYVYGTDDFALGRRAADLTGRYITGPYRYEVLEGVSHWMPEESADATTRLLLEHFRQATEPREH